MGRTRRLKRSAQNAPDVLPTWRSLWTWFKRREISVAFEWVAGARGLWRGDDDEIAINLAYEIADTWVHELLHAKYPDWTERQVKTVTKRILSQTSDQHIAKLMKTLLKEEKDEL